jgi:hypothetical protein
MTNAIPVVSRGLAARVVISPGFQSMIRTGTAAKRKVGTGFPNKIMLKQQPFE